MLKFVLVLASLFAFANCQLGGVGGWTDIPNVPAEVIDLAKWSIVQINKQQLASGEYNLANVRNVKAQVVSGMNYKFTMDTLFVGLDARYIVSFHFFRFISSSIFNCFLFMNRAKVVISIYIHNHGQASLNLTKNQTAIKLFILSNQYYL